MWVNFNFVEIYSFNLISVVYPILHENLLQKRKFVHPMKDATLPFPCFVLSYKERRVLSNIPLFCSLFQKIFQKVIIWICSSMLDLLVSFG